MLAKDDGERRAMRIMAEVLAGSDASIAIEEAVALCAEVRSMTPIPVIPFTRIDRRVLYGLRFIDDLSNQVTVRFNLSDVTVTVTPDSDPNLILRDWGYAREGYIRNSIGPYQNLVSLDKEAKIARIKAKLDNAPALQLYDVVVWEDYKYKNYSDSYGRAIIDFIVRWGRLMQIRIAAGEKLKDIADDTCLEAAIGDISGCMYGAALHVLARCWIHKEPLRDWHNNQLDDDPDDDFDDI